MGTGLSQRTAIIIVGSENMIWAKDLTGIKVRDRVDVQAFDTDAVVKGEITEAVAG